MSTSTPDKPLLGVTERWDTQALAEFREEWPAILGAPHGPVNVRIRTGGAPGRNGRGKRLVAEAYDLADDNVPQIYVNPGVEDERLILAGILREYIRLAAKAEAVGYTGNVFTAESVAAVKFQQNAYTVGFTHKGRYTPAKLSPESTPTWNYQLAPILGRIFHDLGPRPHGKTNLAVRTPENPKAATYMLRAHCGICKDNVPRVTLANLSKGWPLCNGNGKHRFRYFIVESGTVATGFTPVDIANYLPSGFYDPATYVAL